MSRFVVSFALSLAGLLGATNAHAATCSSVAAGNWSAAATWSCVGLPAATVPGAADAVVIASLGAEHVVTVDVNSAAASVSFTGGARGSTLQLAPAIALNVSGAITLNPSTSTNVARQKIFAVGSGTLTAASILITGGTSAARTARLTLSTGTITTIGSITFSGTAGGARLISTGAGMINIGGNLASGGTLTTANTGTINFNGTVAAQSIGAYTTYNNVTIANTNAAGVVSLLGATSMSGALTVASGTLDKSAFTLGVAGNLTVNGAVTGTAGALTLSGIGATVGGTGSITTTDALTITAAKSILPTANLTIAGPIAIIGAVVVTNNGTVTSTSTTGITGSVAGSTWTNAANSTLSVSGALLATGTLAASANPNTINYAGGGQTVKASTYHHLGLSGSGTTTLAAGSTTVGGTLTLGANNLTSGTNALTLSGNCSANSGNGSLSRSSGYVIGNLQLTFPASASTCIYHVGDSTGYAPVTVVLGATAGGTLTGRVDAGDHPETTSSGSGIDAAKSANHYWTLTAATLPPSVTYSATFQFCANIGSCTVTEVDAGANTGNFNVALKSSGVWSMKTAGTRNAYSTQATGISGFGEFAIGEISINNCFSDSFTGADNSSPGTNWSVGNKMGTFGNPVIFGNRLRLTNASTGVATWATLQRMIPAAGNKVTVVFDHFAYGGTHADGIGVILSDASVAPQAGAFGGSLGYAQKGYTPVSDCTTPGGCPGFTGGWLGIGVDEYGNYSTNTEGRYGGSSTRTPNSVALRGSGSGMSGYRFLQGTSTFSPAIDSVAPLTPPHRYRIVVDHTDAIHAWTSVERDTSGGGTAYTTLVGCPPGVTSGCTALDVKDPGYSQNAVPASWNLSFTGSTGALTNIHEIDNLSICTVQGLATPTLHHIKIEHGGAACTNTPATVIVKACADAACSSLYMNSVTVNLSAAPGGTWSPLSPITFSGGQATVTLTDTVVRADTLGAIATSPTAGYATQCFNGATQTCILTFAACTFDVVEVGAAANTPIFTKLASTAFNLDVLLLSAGNQTATAVALVDAGSGSCGTFALLANTSTALPSSFTANQRKTFSFAYANAAPNVRVRVTTAGSTYSCSSDNFAIRPTSFTVTSSATQAGSTGTPVFRAGTDTFSLTATAATSAYTGTPKLNSSLVSTSLINLGALAAVAFPPAVSGISTASGFTYSEVGNFGLSQYAVYDDAFAQVDSVKGECTSNFNNGPAVAGKFGCMFGSAAAGPFGRFVPDHFTATGAISNTCAAGAFTYMGQPFTLSTNVVEARNAANGVTRNYVAPYAPGSVSFGAENADNGSNLLARLAVSAGSWTLGAYTLASANATFTRPATTTSDATWGSFESLDIGLTVTDGDVSTVPVVSGADMNPVAAGGSSFTYKKLTGSPLRMRFGRLKLSNAHGSELLKLPVQVRAQYWNGTAFATNAADNCTVLNLANIALGNYQRNAGDTWTTSPALANTVAIAGVWQINLSKPSPTFTGKGSVDMCVDLGADPVGGTVCSATVANLPYLQGLWSPGTTYDNDPTARATFGVYKGSNEFIYLRESY